MYIFSNSDNALKKAADTHVCGTQGMKMTLLWYIWCMHITIVMADLADYCRSGKLCTGM